MPVTVGPDLIFCCFYLKFLLTWSPKIEGSSFLYTFKFQLWAQPLAWIQTKKSKYRLNQCFSSCNLPPDHLGIHGSADPTFCISDKLPAGVHVAGSWTTLFLFMFGSSEEISPQNRLCHQSASVSIIRESCESWRLLRFQHLLVKAFPWRINIWCSLSANSIRD